MRELKGRTCHRGTRKVFIQIKTLGRERARKLKKKKSTLQNEHHISKLDAGKHKAKQVLKRSGSPSRISCDAEPLAGFTCRARVCRRKGLQGQRTVVEGWRLRRLRHSPPSVHLHFFVTPGFHFSASSWGGQPDLVMLSPGPPKPRPLSTKKRAHSQTCDPRATTSRRRAF